MTALREQRRRLINIFRADPRLWIERCCKIIDKSGREVPFKFTRFQNYYYEHLYKLYWTPYLDPDGEPYKNHEGQIIYRFQGMREVNTKARQLYLSSFMNAIFLHDTIFFKGTRTLIICQGAPEGMVMLEEKAKYYYESAKKINDPLIVLPEPEVDNKSELGFPEINSIIRTFTPGQSTAIASKKGRSIVAKNALMSEVGEWVDAASFFQGVEAALNDPTTNFFAESSGSFEGDYFHTLSKMALAQQGGWRGHFWGWWWQDKYRIPMSHDGEAQEIMSNLSSEEQALVDEHDLDAEQIKWRRHKKADPLLAAKGPRAFKKEYPETYEEAFEKSGASVFNDDEYDLRQLTTNLRPAIPGHLHAIGVDVSDGTGNDNSAIVVIDVDTREIIYTWYSNVEYDSTTLHHKIREVWEKYPGVVGIETNGIGRATISQARNEARITVPNWKYDEALEKKFGNRYRERPTIGMGEDWDEFIHCGHSTYDGLPTMSEKLTTVYLLRAAIKEAVAYYTNPDNDHSKVVGLRIGSQDLIDEFPAFQRVGNTAKAPDGPGLHDDIIMATTVAFRLLDDAEDYRKIFNQRFGVKDE